MGTEISRYEVESIIKAKRYDKLKDYMLIGADFADMDLSHVDFSGLNLVNAVFDGARIHEANFAHANLYGASFACTDIVKTSFSNSVLKSADFTKAVIYDCDFYKAAICTTCFDFVNARYVNYSLADMTRVSFRNATIQNCNFKNAMLYQADLFKADVCKSSFCGASLVGTNTRKIRTDEDTAFFALQCPEKGSFIGFKTAGGKIVELRITEDAYRASATNRRCRCSKAEVLSISQIGGTYLVDKSVVSDYDKNLVYEVGKIVEVKIESEERWNMDVTDGIQFFITRQEAVNECLNRRYVK